LKLHQAAGPVSVKSFFFGNVFFWLALRLGPDYEALGNESFNFGDFGLKLHQAACPMSVKCLFFFLHFSFGLHQGLGLITKLLVRRA
jgi:hypothetical protein